MIVTLHDLLLIETVHKFRDTEPEHCEFFITRLLNRLQRSLDLCRAIVQNPGRREQHI